jgi:YHS domain-containing protein
LLLRLIFLLIVGYIVVSAIKARFARRRGVGPDAVSGQGEEMVLDPQCQSYLPKQEAICQDGKYFCSPECARLFLASKSGA